MTDYAGSGSRRVFAERLLREMDARVAAGSASSLLTQILALPSNTAIVAGDLFPHVDIGTTSAKKVTAILVRDYILGISGGTATIPENLTVTQNLTVNGNTVLGNATSDTITATARFASVLTPSTANTRDLGDTSLPWRTGYFGTSLIAPTGTFATAVSTATLTATTRVTSPLIGTTTAVDVVFDRNSVTQLTLGSLVATFAGAIVATGAVTGVTDLTASGTIQGATLIGTTRVTSPLLGTTTATDVVFDRNSVTQLTLGSLLATFAGAVTVTTTLSVAGRTELQVAGANAGLVNASDSLIGLTRFRILRSGGAASVVGVAFNGTLGSPTAVTSGQQLNAVSGEGWDGSAISGTSSVQILAAENFTGSAQGTRIVMRSATIAGTTLVSRWLFDGTTDTEARMRSNVATCILAGGSGNGFSFRGSDATTVYATLFTDGWVPGTTNTYDLGVTGTRWRNGFLAGTLSVTGAVDFGSTLTLSNDLIMVPVSTVAEIRTNTSDASDTASLGLTPGSALSNTRGGLAILYGNEHASTPGRVLISTGNVSGSDLLLQAAGNTAISITRPSANLIAVTGQFTTSTVVAVGGATISTTTALITPASTTGVSSLRLPHGSAPTAPVDGDIWTTTAGIFVRINGSTIGPLA